MADTFEIDLYTSMFTGKKSKNVKWNKFKKNWDKMERKNHIYPKTLNHN